MRWRRTTRHRAARWCHHHPPARHACAHEQRAPQVSQTASDRRSRQPERIVSPNETNGPSWTRSHSIGCACQYDLQNRLCLTHRATQDELALIYRTHMLDGVLMGSYEHEGSKLHRSCSMRTLSPPGSRTMVTVAFAAFALTACDSSQSSPTEGADQQNQVSAAVLASSGVVSAGGDFTAATPNNSGRVNGCGNLPVHGCGNLGVLLHPSAVHA